MPDQNRTHPVDMQPEELLYRIYDDWNRSKNEKELLVFLFEAKCRLLEIRNQADWIRLHRQPERTAQREVVSFFDFMKDVQERDDREEE